MKWTLKILGLLAVWSILGGIIVLIEPSLLRDVLVPGMYLPFLAAIFGAVWYSGALVFRKKYLALVTATVVTIAASLATLQLMYWFVALAIIFILLFVCYIHFSQ